MLRSAQIHTRVKKKKKKKSEFTINQDIDTVLKNKNLSKLPAHNRQITFHRRQGDFNIRLNLKVYDHEFLSLCYFSQNDDVTSSLGNALAL